jgi:hypothetical protein
VGSDTAEPDDPLELQVTEWDRRGGPGRLDRAAARAPRRFAVLYAIGLGLALGAGALLAAPAVGTWWAWTLAVAMVVVGAALLYVVTSRSARQTAEAVRAWRARRGGARRGGPRTDGA